ncbi:MAG: sensor histidine kinase [Puniceicoccaceae bacterium]
MLSTLVLRCKIAKLGLPKQPQSLHIFTNIHHIFVCLLFLFAMTASSSEELASQSATPLTTAAQVRALSEAAASQALPVELLGVYMGSADPQGIAFILQDESEGIYIQAPAEQLTDIGRGDLLRIEGVSHPGGFAPIVLAQRVEKCGTRAIPEPRKVSLEELHAGQLDAQWVEFSGIVRSVQPKALTDAPPPPPGTRYTVPTSADPTLSNKVKLKLASGLARVMVEVDGPLDPEQYVDARVCLRGLCFNLHNRNRQYVKPFIQVPEGAHITILEAPVENLFEREPERIGNLLRFGPENDSQGRRVHLQGVVVHYRPGVGLWVRDGEHCLRVESLQIEELQPGDVVDVLGFPVPGEYSPVLEDAVFRKRTTQSSPAPLVIYNVSDALRNDANLVQLDARLVEVRPVPGGWELSLDWQGQVIRAHWYHPGESAPTDEWLPDSIVRVVGVCAVLADEPGPLGGLWIPSSFQILLRSPTDVSVLEPPPWWNAERIAWMLSAFLVAALVMIAAIVWISRQHMRDQEHQRAMAEAEFSAILNERNRVAREIHDTLSQGLGSISMQLELARTHADELSSEVRNHLGTAHRLTREALAEARNSIWNMRSHVLEKGDLVDALSRILDQLTKGLEVIAEVRAEGNRRRLSPMVENNLLRIGQEGITNAIKHAQPSRIELTLAYEPRRVRLYIRDDGIGFEAAKQTRPQSGSFGLVGIRERVHLLGGSVDMQSSPGSGTTICVTVQV